MGLSGSPTGHVNGHLEISKFRAYKKKPIGPQSPTPDGCASGSTGAEASELRSPEGRSDMGVRFCFAIKFEKFKLFSIGLV